MKNTLYGKAVTDETQEKGRLLNLKGWDTDTIQIHHKAGTVVTCGRGAMSSRKLSAATQKVQMFPKRR